MDLGAGGARLEIRRVDAIVTMRALEDGDYAFRHALADGLTLEQAACAAVAADPSFELTATLHDVLEERILVGFAVSRAQTE